MSLKTPLSWILSVILLSLFLIPSTSGFNLWESHVMSADEPMSAQTQTTTLRTLHEGCESCSCVRASEYEYPIMTPSALEIRQWIQSYENAPRAYIDPQVGVRLQASPQGQFFSLLDRLDYNAVERNQGWCGDCWVWAGTGVMEIALDVQEGVHDRLSIQYLNSNYNGGSGDEWACCGGWLANVTSFYSSRGRAVPWSNTNAGWQDGHIMCEDNATSVSAEQISTTPRYPISSIVDEAITTQTVNQTAAVSNIKNVLNQNKSVWFAFFLPNDENWSDFFDFWDSSGEDAVWNPNSSCGSNYTSGGGHAVLCVGYNDTDPDHSYWIMLNSWGTAYGNRSHGLFLVDMNIDYNCSLYDETEGWFPSFEWQTINVTFDTSAVIYVDDDYNNTTPGWGVTRFNSISGAVLDANEGDTIVVRNGSYRESVLVEKPLTITSEDGSSGCVVNASNQSGYGFYVVSDNVSLSGFTVVGAAETDNVGVYVNYASNCNLLNNNVTGNYYGILIEYGVNAVLENNSLSGNNRSFGVYGDTFIDYFLHNISTSNNVDGKPIYYWVNRQNDVVPSDAGFVGLINSTNITVANLTITNNGEGVLLAYTDGSTVGENNFSENLFGVYMYYSRGNTLYNNNMFSNDYNFELYGEDLSEYVHDVSNNTVDGRPLYYWVGRQNEVVPSDAGFVAVVNSTNITARDITLSRNGRGILLSYTKDSTLENITSTDNYYGIFLHSSVNNTIKNNVVSNNVIHGIRLTNSTGNTVSNNTVLNNSAVGIVFLSASNSNVVVNNTISRGQHNALILFVDGGQDNQLLSNTIQYNDNDESGNYPSVWIADAYNTVENNTVSYNNAVGMYVRGSPTNDSVASYGNRISGNTLMNNTHGIYLSYTRNNTLQDNTMNYNSEQGLYAFSSNNNTFYGNTANENKHGIYLQDSSNNSIVNNTAVSNMRHGFYSDADSTGNTLYYDTFHTNNQEGGDYYDIYNEGNTTGDDNQCNTVHGYNDDGALACTYAHLVSNLAVGWNMISFPVTI